MAIKPAPAADGTATNAAVIGKRKNWKIVLANWKAPEGSSATSSFGAEFNGVLDCEDLEFTSIGLPDPDEDEVLDLTTSHRTIKLSVPKKSWQNWSKIGVINDEDGNNWKMFASAKELETTGDVQIHKRNGTGTTLIASFHCSVTGFDSGEGGADELSDSFTPTFAILNVNTGTGA